jgi:hypothetical protein
MVPASDGDGHGGLKLIGAGWGRTGTASLKLALEQLGLAPCYHMLEVIRNPAFVPLWMDVADGRPDWQRIFAGYQATVDFPAALHWRELAALYPRAKILLSVRDSEAWFQSTQETIFSARLREATRDTPMSRMIARVVHAPLGGRMDDRAGLIGRYEAFNRDVIESLPADRLLVYNVAEGWGPLCAFLGLPVPDTPFPRVNSREEFAEMIRAAGHPG